MGTGCSRPCERSLPSVYLVLPSFTLMSFGKSDSFVEKKEIKMAAMLDGQFNERARWVLFFYIFFLFFVEGGRGWVGRRKGGPPFFLVRSQSMARGVGLRGWWEGEGVGTKLVRELFSDWPAAAPAAAEPLESAPLLLIGRCARFFDFGVWCGCQPIGIVDFSAPFPFSS